MNDGTPDPSPTEEELEARAIIARHLFKQTKDGPIFDQGIVDDFAAALRSARESARVATRERDEARRDAETQRALLHGMQDGSALRDALTQLTDRDRMIARLRDALKIAMGAVHQLMDEHANAAAGADVPLTSVGTAMGDQAMRAAGSLVYDSHPIAAAIRALASKEEG